MIVSNSAHIRLSRRFSEDALAFAIRDADGEWILDFAGGAVKAVNGRELGAQLVHPAYNFVRQEHERFVKEGNEKLAPRYEKLRHYIESRLSLW
jgi:hypothetical protein